MAQRFGLALCFALALGSGLVLAQASPTPQTPQTPQTSQAPPPPTPTFKAEVEYVEVDAVVTDQAGRFVRNLTSDDFQVFEDGKPQVISNFSIVDIPVERADRPLYSSRAIDPDVMSNERPFDGRVYVMLLDDLHVAASRTERVRASARQFIERSLGANDLMAVVFTGGRAQDSQDFTNNRRLLTRAVNAFVGQKLDGVTISRNREFFRQLDAPIQDSRIPDPDETQRVANARSLLSTITRVSEWYGGVRGRRKTLLLFSEGLDYDVTDISRPIDAPAGYGPGLTGDIREAIATTERANVSIYAIDPRGLTTLADDTIGVQSFADQESPGSGIGTSSLNNELRLSQDMLRQVSEDTGGFAVINRNDVNTSFTRIVSDNSSYYVLAYMPPSTKRDGKFHRIEVKTKRPGLTVRARRGYGAARGKAPASAKTGGMPEELFAAVSSPLPVSGVSMRAFAAPFKGTQPNASVLVGLELFGKDLTLDGNSKVDVSMMAIDSKAKISGSRNDTLTLNLRPETRMRVAQSGIRVLNRIDLAPGRYQLRLAARDAARTAAGSVIYDLEVPDFFKSPFTISGLMITSLGSGAMMTAKADDQMRAVLPAPPVAQRVFAQNDELAVFAEVYDNAPGTPHKVDITTTVLTDEGRVVFKTEESRDSSELQGAKGGFGYTARVPLTDVAPGAYVLNVQARSRLGTDTTAAREVRIRVVESARP